METVVKVYLRAISYNTYSISKPEGQGSNTALTFEDYC